MHPYRKLAPGSGARASHFLNGAALETAPGPLTRAASPYDGRALFEVADGGPAVVNQAVELALAAAPEWAHATYKERARVLFDARAEILKDLPRIVATKSFESGKTLAEAEAGLMKGLEVLEFALSLQNQELGGRMEVSRGVWCEARRVPVGVVAGITPFNFPAMVPMWMLPIALALGNAFILKPSDKTPLTPLLLAEAFKRAGLPNGILQIVQGGRATVEAILDHPGIGAVGFVGSTPVAQEVYRRGTSKLKRVLALGGAKNPVILLPDADPAIAAQGIADSFTGCAGQRCMAASLLLAVEGSDTLIDAIVEKAAAIRLAPASEGGAPAMGAIITKPQVEFLKAALDRATRDGAKLKLDGRSLKPQDATLEGGNWLGPSVLDGVAPDHEAATRELFGPVLSVVRCKSLEEALQIESKIPYGNATSVFTQSGAMAEEVAKRATAGMIGINVGVPVPREPYSFGGWHDSRFGAGDITGMPALALWSNLKKVTTKWTPPKTVSWMG